MAIVENAADFEKFEKIFSEYRDYMYCVAFCILRNRESSENVVGQAFGYIAQNLDQFGNGRSLFGVKDQVACLVVKSSKRVLEEERENKNC